MAYQYVTQGELSAWYWFGIIGLGLLVPLILNFIEIITDKTNKSIANAVAGFKFVSLIAGGFILRLVVVWDGEMKAPLDFPSTLNQIPFSG